MIKKLHKIILRVIYPILMLPVIGRAAEAGGSAPITLENPLGATRISDLVDRVLGFLIIVSAPIATIMIIVGAFQILMAGGEVEKVKTGKKTILYAAIGFAIVLLAKGITAIVKDILGVQG